MPGRSGREKKEAERCTSHTDSQADTHTHHSHSTDSIDHSIHTLAQSHSHSCSCSCSLALTSKPPATRKDTLRLRASDERTFARTLARELHSSICTAGRFTASFTGRTGARTSDRANQFTKETMDIKRQQVSANRLPRINTNAGNNFLLHLSHRCFGTWRTPKRPS